jgi:hypothetical protein
LSEKKIKNQQEKKMPKIRLTLSIICHRYFDTNHFITWFVYFLVCFGDNQFSDNSKCFHRNGFEMYMLIIIYTVCTCDKLVPTRILNSEISWFCFDYPKWGPVSFIITDFNDFVQFFE